MADPIATQVEDWLIATIRLIEVDGERVFEDSEVKPWNGTTAGNVAEFTDELFTSHRDIVCAVFFQADTTRDLSDGEIELVPRYVILVGIRNKRPAAARRGDAEFVGTNRLRDVLRYAVNNQRPLNAQAELINDGTTVVDRLKWTGSRLVVAAPNICIQQSTVEATEVPKSA